MKKCHKNLDDEKISYVKRILNQIFYPKNIERKLKKKLCDIENKKNLSELEKEESNDYLNKISKNS